MNSRMGAEKLKERLVTGIKWTVVLSVVVSASNFASTVVAARLLGMDQFGAFSIIRSTVIMMAGVAGMGIGIAATKYVAELRDADTTRLGKILGLCSVITIGTGGFFAVTLLIFAGQLAEYSFNAPQISDHLRLAAIYIFFITLNEYQVGLLTGFESFAKLARVNLGQAVGAFLLTYLMTSLWGLTGATLSLGAAALLNWYLNHSAIKEQLHKHQIVISYRDMFQEKAVLINFAFPTALSGFIGSIAVWGCNAYMVRQPDGLVQMAIFTAAASFRSLIMFVPGLVTRVVTPVLCNLVGEKKTSSYSKVFAFNVLISAIASTGIAGLLALTAPKLLAVFGKGFSGGSDVAVLIAVVSIVEVMANTFYQPLLAYGRIWWQFQVIVCWSLILVSITLFTVADYGALGLAWAYMAAHLVSLAMYLFAGYRIKKTTEPSLVNG